MNLPFFLARRIIFQAQPSFSRFIIRLAVAATALSVATMIITLALVNGFQQAVADKVFSFWGDVRVQALEPMRSLVSEDAGFERNDSAEALFLRQPELLRYHAFITRSVVFKSREQFEGALLKGVDERFDAKAFDRFLRLGRSMRFEGEGYSRDLLMSEPMARRLQVKPGDTLQCLFIRRGEDIRSRPVVVCGLFKTGIEEYDKQFALADIRLLQRLNQWTEDRIGGYELWLKPGSQSATVSDRLDGELPIHLRSLTIQQIFPNIFDWLGIQDQTKRIILGTMLVVAIINLITCLLILVMERTKMVGVLKSLGMHHGQIGSIFWYYAGWIAVVGVGLGLLIGLGLCWLQQATGFIRMDETTYYVDRAPVKLVAWQVAALALGSLAVCLLAIRIPLVYVQRISPVKAIRFE